MTAQLPAVTPLTFEEAKTELALLAVSLREGTMTLDEWCEGVHATIAGYEAGKSESAPHIRGASGADAGKPPNGRGVRPEEASAAEPATIPRAASANRTDNRQGEVE